MMLTALVGLLYYLDHEVFPLFHDDFFAYVYPESASVDCLIDDISAHAR